MIVVFAGGRSISSPGLDVHTCAWRTEGGGMFGCGRRGGACVACESLFFPPFMGRLGAFVGGGRGQIGGRRRGVGVEVWFAGCAERGGLVGWFAGWWGWVMYYTRYYLLCKSVIIACKIYQ